MSEIYELQLYASYKTSPTILQNMLEKVYSHRFYSRAFSDFILALHGYS